MKIEPKYLIKEGFNMNIKSEEWIDIKKFLVPNTNINYLKQMIRSSILLQIILDSHKEIDGIGSVGDHSANGFVEAT